MASDKITRLLSFAPQLRRIRSKIISGKAPAVAPLSTAFLPAAALTPPTTPTISEGRVGPIRCSNRFVHASSRTAPLSLTSSPIAPRTDGDILGIGSLSSNRHWQPMVLSSQTIICCRYFSTSSGSNSEDDKYNNPDDPHAMYKEQMEQLKLEREEMFGFSEDDEKAWSSVGSSGTDQLPQSLMQQIEWAREEEQRTTVESPTEMLTSAPLAQKLTATTNNTTNSGTQPTGKNNNGDLYQPLHGLTHLSEDGSSVRMVDVGGKAVTQRMARAETRVVLPPEVVAAFQQSKQENELVGPKGPIFATAKIAGIMAAKKTSDLIPLCHPLPLDNVQIDIQLEKNNIAIITCECRVTHKTGVEMEALTGATVAALTVYDMVKAVSHNIRIEQTILTSKSGGKREVG